MSSKTKTLQDKRFPTFSSFGSWAASQMDPATKVDDAIRISILGFKCALEQLRSLVFNSENIGVQREMMAQHLSETFFRLGIWCNIQQQPLSAETDSFQKFWGRVNEQGGELGAEFEDAWLQAIFDSAIKNFNEARTEPNPENAKVWFDNLLDDLYEISVALELHLDEILGLYGAREELDEPKPEGRAATQSDSPIEDRMDEIEKVAQQLLKIAGEQGIEITQMRMQKGEEILVVGDHHQGEEWISLDSSGTHIPQFAHMLRELDVFGNKAIHARKIMLLAAVKGKAPRSLISNFVI